MGNQGSSGDDTRRIEAWVQQGVLGDVHTVYTWTNRPVWPQGVPLPQEAQPVPEGVRLGTVAGSGPATGLPRGLYALPLAGVVGLWHRGTG